MSTALVPSDRDISAIVPPDIWELKATSPCKREITSVSRNSILKAVVWARSQTVTGRVCEAGERPLPEPVKLCLERLDFSRLRPGKVDETTPGGDTLHAPSSLCLVGTTQGADCEARRPKTLELFCTYCVCGGAESNTIPG